MKNKMKNKYKGIFPALVTPFDKNGKVNTDALGKLVERNIELGVNGFYVGGSTGESYLLSKKERMQVLEAVIEAANRRVDVIVNVGVFATEHGIELAKHAEKFGAAAISSVPPFYFAFNMEEYVQYYNEIVSSVEIPMIVYNIPAMSGIELSKQNIEELFKNEKIVGIKHTSYNLFQMEKIIDEYPEKSVFIGHDEVFLSAYAAGAEAAIGSTFNFTSKKFIKIQEFFGEGKMAEALEIQSQINAVIEVLCKIGVIKGVKAALKMQGIDCGVCRKPFAALSKEDEKQLEAFLLKTGCL